MVRVSVEIRSNRFPGMGGKLTSGARRLVAETAEDVRQGAAERSRVDTGEMRAGWQARMTGATEAEVVNAVEHAIYNEYGTVNLSPQPMAVPAADAAMPGFVAGARALIEGL